MLQIMAEDKRLELLTSCVQNRRSANWATDPYGADWQIRTAIRGLQDHCTNHYTKSAL